MPKPGYTREEVLPTTANDKRAFIYRNSKMEILYDPAVITRINTLRIPPGYTNVWISAYPLAHIQARSLDTRLRPQYRYHDLRTSEVLTPLKFTRMQAFGGSIAKMRIAVNYHLAKPIIDVESKLAAVVRLLETAGIRIGGEKYAKSDVASFGLATLKVEHLLELNGPHIRLKFVAKEGLVQDISIIDAQVARVLEVSIANKSSSDKIFGVTSGEVNRYIKRHLGSSFSAKDFRTWVGTTQAASTLHRLGPLRAAEDQEQAILLAAGEASLRLHNAPDTAIKYYIAPQVLEAYRTDQLISAFSQIIDENLSAAENAVLFLTK